MSKTRFVLALLLSIGLGPAWSQEAREKKDGTPPSEKSVARPPAARAAPAPAAAPSPAPGSLPSPSPQRGSTDSRLRKYAETLLRQYDKNKNGNIEKDEWGEMSSRWREADRDADGTITLDELVAHLSPFDGRVSGKAITPPGPSSPPVRALPPVSQERPIYPRGEMPRPVRSYPPTGTTFTRPSPFGAPARPIDPRAPLVSVQLVMMEVVADVAEKTGSKTQTPASSDLTKTPATLPLDLSAPSEKILEELRKLGVRGRLDVFYRIQLTAADQQDATFQLGQREPRVVGVTISQFGQANRVDYLNTGLIVQVRPQVAGGAVSTRVAIEESRVGRADEGIPISAPAKGEPVRAAPVHTRTMQTVVNAPNGQTIVLTGLTEEGNPHSRQVVILLCAHIVASNPSETPRPAR